MTVIDSNKMSIICAGKNIKANNISNATVMECDAKQLDNIQEVLAGKSNMFILDPPRAGLHKKTVKFIKKNPPEKMIYMSCNPRQLAFDLNILKELYDIKDMVIFDMFPQTRHMEMGAVLERAIKN